MSMPSPAKKRLREDSDDETSFRSDRGMDCEDEPDEYEDSEEVCHGKEDLIQPHIMLAQLESFRKFLAERGKLSVSMSRIKGLFDEWFAHGQKDSPMHDSEIFIKSFKRYVAASLKPTNMSVESCFRNVSDYLGRPDSVLMHPDFPVKPPSLVTYYTKKFGYSTGFGKMREVTDRMKVDQVGRQECERELGEIEKAFLEKLEEFLTNNHEVLLPKQAEFVEHKIKLLRKKVFPPQRISKLKNNRQSNGFQAKQVKTAFDLFCCTKQDKYKELPADVRERKLKKKFDKLPDDKKEIFEKLAQIG